MKNLDTFYGILSQIYENSGVEAFKTKKFIAILSDMAPDFKEEIIVTKKLYYNGIIKQIIDEDCGESSVKKEVARYSLILQDEE